MLLLLFITAKLSIGRRVFNYIMGISGIDEDEKETRAMAEHIERVAELRQSKLAKVCLTIGLCTILLIGTVMYVFWSLYKFDSAPFYPMGATNETLLPGDVIPGSAR